MTATALLLAAVLAVAPAAPGASSEVDLVTGSTGSARVEVPYPGHSTAFDVTAHAAAGAGPSDLSLLLDGSGPLADGPDALRLTLTDTEGAVLAEGTTAELRGRHIRLGVLDEQPVTVHGSATLPASAGDAAQGAGMQLTFRLVAESDAAPTRSAVLATTGARVLVVAGIAAALLAGGLLLLAARRRSKEDS